MKGIQTPYIYVGALRTGFPWHLEDGNANSLNYLHSGAPKVW